MAHGALPDPDCTPGEVFAGVTSAQICVPGYSATVRNVGQAEKDAVFAEYGVITHSGATFEVDHLIPLELGGDNALANLWPEPASPTPGFHQKDTLENRLHADVCAGRLNLTLAQDEIATDWLVIVQ